MTTAVTRETTPFLYEHLSRFFGQPVLFIRGDDFNFILMAAPIALGCELILLGEFRRELTRAGN
jgi:hypothetical protein